jgi:hypothetical protein
MKKTDDAEKLQSSGLFQGSEPLEDVQHRSAAKKDADGRDGLLGDKGDDDSSDSDKSDSDSDATDTDSTDSDATDKKDGDARRDADGRD